MKKYRYILNGVVLGKDQICDYRLIGGKNIRARFKGKAALKVYIPEDLKLEKWSCDNYSTTEDTRTIDELGYDLMIWNGYRWKERNDLKGNRPCDIPTILRSEV